MPTAIFWLAIYLGSAVNTCPSWLAYTDTAFASTIDTTTGWTWHGCLAVITHPSRPTVATSSKTTPMAATSHCGVRVRRIRNFTLATHRYRAIVPVPCNIALAFTIVAEAVS